MNGVEAVLFDLDGTLINTPPAIAVALRAAVADTTGEELNLASIIPLIGRPLPVLCGELVNRDEDDPVTTAVTAAYQDHYRRDIVPNAKNLLFPDVAAGVAALAADGKQLAIVTSKNHHAAELILGSAGLLPFFDVIVGADDVGTPKPAADAGHHALQLLAAAPASAVMVGDSADDIHMADAVPMRSIGVTYGATSAAAMAALQPTFIANNFPAVASALAIDSTAKDAVHS
ncbi:HAD family hydrolase [Curtobacterium sp. MCPF17_002]|uniref:HAD family hydrolase n=1 Tax=Curtobacterium sp. MCPF17_002 TaxID=2175645 RepID=UPI0015E8A5DA|nr:HAD family hydrolase [Curtobacterium sp. MCPF17_002]WIB75834.1 HAD family hydrolase [Curtobacterium sp. MCPF17_002]